MNVILLSVDSFRADALGAYGSNWCATPHLDRLAEECVLFENAWAQTPHTIPSHAGMLTGLYPFTHGLRKDSGVKISPRAMTLFELFTRLGWRTASFISNPIFGVEYGYHDWNDQGRPYLPALSAYWSSVGIKPFFLFLHTYDLHVPYCCRVPARTRAERRRNLLLLWEQLSRRRLPPKFRDRHIPIGGEQWMAWVNRVVDLLADGGAHGRQLVRQGYREAVAQIDRWIGGIVHLLRHHRLWDETLLIVTADHGDSFNEHNEFGINRHWSSVHGAFLHENVLRVPLLVHFPTRTVAPRRVDAMVESIDIVPTIIELLGPPAEAVRGDFLKPEGLSLLAAVRGQPKTSSYSETLIREHHQVCFRNQTHKLIIDKNTGSEQLFAWRTDREEHADLAPEHPELVARLRGDLASFLNARAGTEAVTPMSAAETARMAKALQALGYI